RWLVSDVRTWYPVAGQPQRHLGAALAAAVRQDGRTAAAEVRKAAAYVRLEAARATGDARQALARADAELAQTARALDKDAVKSDQALQQVLARAGHALALAHHERAAQAFAHKEYEQAGYELKAAAQSLQGAAQWGSAQTRAAAQSADASARTVGDKLAGGGVWARDEVAAALEGLGHALDRLGQDVGAAPKPASPRKPT
ncbi:MAG: hypothetical protein Q4G71_18300, partial [Pseudomonadota bacterium]|nr:hypothetical protein [Pseudomonadota bacterium]